MTKGTHSYRLKSEATKAEGLGHQAIRLGRGAYAQVLLAEEHIERHDKSVRSDVVAKIFLDSTPEDANLAFEREVELLERLRGRRNIVSIRGIERRRPPTFVCGECGDVFSVERCPDCEAPLFNEGELNAGASGKVILHCNGVHVFERTDQSFVRLLSRRPCGHGGPCDVVNFLFRPCIYLEPYSVNLREYADLLGQRKEYCAGHAIFTLNDPHRDKDAWLRETFLMRLAVLVRIAEALEQVHRRGHVHADVAPENVMVLLPPKLDDESFQIQTPALIDFGQARRAELPRETVVVQGRHHFIAPEVTGVNNSIETSARIDVGPITRDGGECELICRVDLAEGDYVWDGQGNSYEVVRRIESEPSANRDSDTDMADQLRERTYQLRILSCGKSTPGSGVLWTNQSVRPPADVFSFGCVAAWLLTDGNELCVQHLRSAAQFAASESQSFEEALRNLRERKTYSMVISKIPLPNTPHDEDVKYRVLEAVLRCLMRIDGAYCANRAAGFERAAVKASKDLQIAYDYLYFLQRTSDKFYEFLGRDHQRSYQRMDEQVVMLRRSVDAAASEHAALAARQAEHERGLQARIDSAMSSLLEERRGRAEAIAALEEALRRKQQLEAQFVDLEQSSAELVSTIEHERIERSLISSLLEDEATARKHAEASRDELERTIEKFKSKIEKTEATRTAIKLASERVLDLESTLDNTERRMKRWKSAFLVSTLSATLLLATSGLLVMNRIPLVKLTEGGILSQVSAMNAMLRANQKSDLPDSR